MGGGRIPRALDSLLMRLLMPLAVAALLLLSACSALERARAPYWQLSSEPSGQAPDPATTPEAVVQVYAARTVGWRGLLAVHSWIAVKRRGAPAYTRYEVMGWGVAQGRAAIRIDRAGPDNHWFGGRPDRLVDRRGPEVETLIDQIEAAVRSYPYPDTYRSWPGPNSNTFIAHIGREVPELRLDLPPTAIGKDFLANGHVTGMAPSGTGVQLSWFGLGGVLLGWEEGLELNVLGLSFGLDLNRPALRLPAVGRVGFP
jgi:hypothetical protein